MAASPAAWLVALCCVQAPSPPGAEAADTLETALNRAAPPIQLQVAALRGRPYAQPVRWRVAERATIVAETRAYMARDFPPGRMAQIAAAQAAWGLLPRGYDLTAAHLALFADGVSAYYDPRGGVLVVPAGTPTGRVESLLAHELVHALQDQHFDLDALVQPRRFDDDQVWARAAVVEGEAVCVAHLLANRGRRVTLYELQAVGRAWRERFEQRAERAGALHAAPLVLRENMIFPYAEGTQFVAQAWASGGASALEACWADLPASTEQVLHPDRYFGVRDQPSPVAAPDLRTGLGAGWRLLEANVVGEQLLRVVLRSTLPAAIAIEAAAGWDGLRYAVYGGPGGQRTLAFRSVWDSAGDAADFVAAYRTVRDARSPDAQWSQGGWRWLRGQPAGPRLEQRGRRVCGLEGAPRARVAALWREVWEDAE